MKSNYLIQVSKAISALRIQNKTLYGFIIALMFSLPQIVNGQCNYSLELSDTFGDGWNGGQIEVTTGTTVATFTLATGAFQAVPLSVNTGDSIILNFLGGSLYNGELSFELKDVGGTSLYSSGQGPATGIAFSTVANCPSCLPPGALGVSGLTATEAFAIWQAGGTESAWDIEYDTAGFTPGTGNMASPTSTQYYMQNLTPQTAYEFYVRADCNGSTSSWVGPFSFTTACVAVTSFPYSEDFETSTSSIPQCWVNEQNDDEDWIFRSGSIGHGSTGDHTTGSGFYAGVDDSQGLATDTLNNLLTPLFDLTSLTTPRLTFWYFIGNDATLTSTLYIDVYDGSTWNMGVSTITHTSAAWLQANVDLSAYNSANSQIRFRGVETSDFNSDISIDDIIVEETPSCPNPTLLTMDSVSASTVYFGWTNGGSETSWNVEYGMTGFTQGSGTVMTVSSNPAMITGLMANTAYQIYVQADCGNNDLSPWQGPINATTGCSSYTTGYFQNFDGLASPSYDACWSEINATGSTALVRTSSSTSNPQRSAPNSIEFYSGSASSGFMLLVSPEFSDLDASKRVRFYVQDEGSTAYIGNLVIGIMSDPTDTSTFTPLHIVLDSELSSNWLEVAVNLQSGLGNYVAFAYQVQGTFDYLYIDDFYYEDVPSCFKPSNFASSNVTATSADFSWTANSYPNNWEVEYGISGYTPGSGTSTFVSDTMATVSSLSDATTYDFYVREICSAGDSSFFEGPVTLTTNCLAVNTYPYLETFDAVAATPNCWAQSATNVENWLVNTGSGATYGGAGSDHTSGSGNFAWVDDSQTQVANPAGLESPIFDLTTLNTPSLKFWFTNRGTSLTGNTSKFYVDIYDGTSWTNGVDSVVGVNVQAWTELSVNLTSYKSSTTQIRFTVFEEPTNFYSDVSIDDIVVGDFPMQGMGYASNMTACSGDTIMLVGMAMDGSGNYTYSWSGSNVMNSSNDTAWVVASSSEDFVLTINDGFTSIMDTLSVNVNATPQISITTNGDDWCDALTFMANGANDLQYLWFDNSTGNSTELRLSDGITKFVTLLGLDTATGCVGMASNFVYMNDYIQAYTLVAKQSIELPKKNKVIGGGVGVTDANGFASIGNFGGPESTNGFVTADILDLGGNSNYTYFSDTTANVMLPNHIASTVTGNATMTIKAQRGATKVVAKRGIGADIIVERDANVTLTEGSYGDILVKVGGTLTFTSSSVEVKSLNVQNSSLAFKGVNIVFTQDASLSAADYIYLGARSKFNESGNNVNVYVGSSINGGDFEFKPADILINANIYVMGGMVKAGSAFSAKWSKVNGRVIADDIYSKSEKIRWNFDGCGMTMPILPLAALKVAEQGTDEVVEIEQAIVINETLEFTIAPNPTNGQFAIQLDGSLLNTTEEATITITAQDGRVVENRTINKLNSGFNQEFSLDKYSDGIYFVTVLVGNQVINEKIVLTR